MDMVGMVCLCVSAYIWLLLLYIIYTDRYFYITGIRDIIINIFNPTRFRIEYNDHSTYWHKYYVNISRLDSKSKNLIPIRNQEIKYRFIAEYIVDLDSDIEL